MLDFLTQSYSIASEAGHHAISLFPVVPAKAMGLDDAPMGSSASIKGPAEYIFQIATSPPVEQNGVMLPTGAYKTTPTIKFLGENGTTETIPIKYGIKAGHVGEFAAIAKDVGKIKSIRLENANSQGDMWHPTSVRVNRLGSLCETNLTGSPDGWITFDVNRAITEPAVFNPATEKEATAR